MGMESSPSGMCDAQPVRRKGAGQYRHVPQTGFERLVQHAGDLVFEMLRGDDGVQVIAQAMMAHRHPSTDSGDVDRVIQGPVELQEGVISGYGSHIPVSRFRIQSPANHRR
uniref:Uncharacterized protein n=1 Tax=Spongospora subterranea TaxID=70186 RepID=A0A0H5R4I2_9EUKA|eukprot:CRZ09048.1 hypothetical protein [Spongospora subterranea]